MKRKSKAYAPRKMRENWKQGAVTPPRWLDALDRAARACLERDVDEGGFSRVHLEEFLSKCDFLSEEHIELARRRYAPFFAPKNTEAKAS